MSTQDLRAFLSAVSSDSDLQTIIQDAITEGSLDLLDTAEEAGFEFTEDEAVTMLEEIREEDGVAESDLRAIAGESPIDDALWADNWDVLLMASLGIFDFEG